MACTTKHALINQFFFKLQPLIMNVVIRTGFAKVKHAIYFQSEMKPKGKKLFEANHVRCIQVYRQNGISLFIQAEVVRQESESSEAYKT